MCDIASPYITVYYRLTSTNKTNFPKEDNSISYFIHINFTRIVQWTLNSKFLLLSKKTLLKYQQKENLTLNNIYCKLACFLTYCENVLLFDCKCMLMEEVNIAFPMEFHPFLASGSIGFDLLPLSHVHKLNYIHVQLLVQISWVACVQEE